MQPKVRPLRLIACLAAVALLVVLVAGLASCTPKPKPGPSGPTGVGNPNGPKTPESTPKGPATGEPIKIGAVLPLTGDGAAYGKSAREGMDLAVTEINAQGGAGGRPIAVVYEDSRGSPKDGVAAFQKLVTQDRVPAVVGDLLSSVTLAMAPSADTNQVVLLSPTSTAPALSGAGDFVFRNCPSDVFEGRVMAEYASTSLHLGSVGILAAANDYGKGISDVFESRFKGLGGAVPLRETYAQGATDFRVHLTKLATSGIDAVYLVGYKEQGRILKQAAEMGFRVRFLSTVMLEDPEVLSTAGGAAEGVVYSAPAFNIASDDPSVKGFRDRFEAACSRAPDIFAAASYDAVGIVASALGAGAVTGPSIRDALYATTDYPGIIGRTSFDSNGDASQPAVLKVIQDGRPVAAPAVR